MKIKKVQPVKTELFDAIYSETNNVADQNSQAEFDQLIQFADRFSFSESFWYVADFSVGTVVAVGGDYKKSSPFDKEEWIGMQAQEIGRAIHPSDRLKMEAFIVYIAELLSKINQKQIDQLRISIVFRMKNKRGIYTWRVIHYPKIVYTNRRPRLLFCVVSDLQHLIYEAKCCMYILNHNNTQSLYYCDNESLNLQEFRQQTPLSKREIEVVLLLCKGLISKEVAAHLGLSKNTIENHKQRIFEKTGTKNIAELIAYAHQHLSNELN